MLSLTRNPLIPLTIRKKIGKFVTLQPGRNFQMKIFEHAYYGTTGIHMDDKIWLYGMHEAATLRLIRRILTQQKGAGKTPVYMDVGTNTGVHLMAAAGIAEKVYGFEPWERVREKVERNISLNGLTNAKVFPFGLSDVQAQLPFSAPEGNNLGVGAFMSAPGAKSIPLMVQRGDDVVRDNDIRPTLIKMDVEGHEKKALTGLHDTLRRFRPAVIFEYGDESRADLGNIKTLRSLFGEGYAFHGIRRSRERPALELFNPAKKYENVLAVHAES